MNTDAHRSELLLVVYIHEFGVDYILFRLLILGRRRWRTLSSASVGVVHGFGQFVARLGEAVGGGVELLGVIVIDRLLDVFNGGLNVLRVAVADLVAMVLQSFFDAENHLIGAVASFDLLLRLAVIGSVRLGVAGHLLDFFLGEAGG